MSLNVEFKFDESLTLTWECAGIKPFIESISFLHELPKTCPVCEAPVHFFYRNPQGNSYYGLRCSGGPAHESNMGQHKPPLETLYYKGDESWELEYSAREGGEQRTTPPAQPGSAAPAPSQPAQAAQPAKTGPSPADQLKAPIEKLNMIGAVARAKKVGDVDAFCKAQLPNFGFAAKGVSELTGDEADIILSALKML